MHPTTPRAKSRAAGVVFALLVLIGFAVVNLPYRYIQGGGVWIGVQAIEQPWSQVERYGTPVMAGWPFRYQIDYEYPSWVERRRWSNARWAANAAIALAIALSVYAGTQYRQRKIETAADPKRLQKRFDIAVAVAVLLFPGVFWSTSVRQAWRDLRLARQVAPSGGCCFLAWRLPEVVASRLPDGLDGALRRIRCIQLHHPPAEMVRRTARVTTLGEYHVHGGTYPPEALAPLRTAPHLAALSITARKLDPPLLRAIAAPRWLTRLCLAQTDLDANSLRHLEPLDSLRLVDFSQTPLQLGRLGKPSWSRTVHTLLLPRPPSGHRGRLTLDGWPCLEQLSVKRSPLELNEQPLELRLSRLPKLSRLSLDRVQKHRLFARNLPRLTSISENFDYMSKDFSSLDSVPGGTWFSHLQLEHLPCLSQLNCFAADLETVRIRRCAQLRHFGLIPFSINPTGASILETVEPARCQRWIDAFCEGDGPAELQLEGLPLSNVDLAPLAGNRGIRHLKLSHTGVRFEQLRSLQPMQQLEQLDIAHCPLDAEQLQWLLERFPRLERLRGNLEHLQRLEIAGNRQLEMLGENRIHHLRELRISGTPQLACAIHMVEAPKQLVIRDAPRLTGLAVEGPWPKDATVRGIRKLRWFAAGGPEVDDELVESLLDCDQLDQLTLAYGSVSRDQLIRIGKFHGLTQLALPGADVDDSVTRHWHAMQYLRQVNLDDTAISAETFSWLSRLEGLRRLSIRRVPLDEAACRALGQLTQLAELDLDGTSVPPEAIAPILAMDLLEKIDLSGHGCEPALIDLLAGCDSLRTLVWHRTDIEPAMLERLLSANPNLHVALDPVPPELNPGVLAELDMRRRRSQNNERPVVGWITGFNFAFALPVTGVDEASVERPANAEDSVQETLSVSQSAASVQAQRALAGYIDARRFRP